MLFDGLGSYAGSYAFRKAEKKPNLLGLFLVSFIIELFKADCFRISPNSMYTQEK